MNWATDYKDFTDDAEKMRDFYILTKEEFLKSYSYIKEIEYDLTAQKRRTNNDTAY
jgi:hypothetical protein